MRERPYIFHLFFILLSADPDDYEYEYEFEFELDFDFDFEYENVWTLRNLGVGDIIREAIRTVITKLRGRCQSTFAAVISCWDHSLQPFFMLASVSLNQFHYCQRPVRDLEQPLVLRG